MAASVLMLLMGMLLVTSMETDCDDRNKPICLLSKTTIKRKKAESKYLRELSARKQEDAKRARKEARIKEIEEEKMDKKNTKALNHAEELRKQRNIILRRINGYHDYIDHCTEEMRKCEETIEQHRGSIRIAQHLIRT